MHEAIKAESRSHGITMTRLISNLARDIVERYPASYRIPGISCQPCHLHIYGNISASTRTDLQAVAQHIGVDTSSLIKVHFAIHKLDKKQLL